MTPFWEIFEFKELEFSSTKAALLLPYKSAIVLFIDEPFIIGLLLPQIALSESGCEEIVTSASLLALFTPFSPHTALDFNSLKALFTLTSKTRNFFLRYSGNLSCRVRDITSRSIYSYQVEKVKNK